MSIVHALADLQTWPGQSKLHFGVLEDTIENVFSLMKVNSEPKTFQPFAKECRLLATQTMDPSQFMGQLLRRPFQGLSSIKIDKTNHIACQAFSFLQNGNEIALDVEHEVNAPEISLRAFDSSILPVLDQVSQFRLHVGFDSECEVPSHVGLAKAYRWNPLKKNPNCTLVIDQGTLRGMPWLMSLASDGKSFQLWTAKKDTPEDDDKSSIESPTASEMDLVNDVLEGQTTDFSDVRHVLQCPAAVQKKIEEC